MNATSFARRASLVAFALGATGLAACDKPRAMGDPTQIMVGAPQAYWDQLEESIKAALDPSTFTVRDERVFDVAHIDPVDPDWRDLRLMRQVLLIGDAEAPAVSDALSQYRGDPPAPPTIFQVRNVWAQNQLVTVALLPTGAGGDALESLLPTIGEIYLRQFEDYARSRMFVTGPNTELADSLVSQAGFTLTLPRVYYYGELEPGLYAFRNDQPDPSRLIRNITVASRERGEVALTGATAREWRAELGSRLNQPPQVTEEELMVEQLLIGGNQALQVQGIWSNPPGEWPAAGSYIARIVECPTRTYLVDAWLYAPGVPKYEYMYQLKTILDSFACSGEA